MQLADDLFNSGNIPVAGIPRLPGLVRTLDEFNKTADVLKPYLEKAFANKGIVMLAAYTYPLQVVWGKKKLTSLDDFKGMSCASPTRAGRDGAPFRRYVGDDLARRKCPPRSIAAWSMASSQPASAPCCGRTC